MTNQLDYWCVKCKKHISIYTNSIHFVNNDSYCADCYAKSYGIKNAKWDCPHCKLEYNKHHMIKHDSSTTLLSVLKKVKKNDC